MDNAEDRGEYRSTSNADHRGSYRRSECYKQGVGEGSHISKVQNFRCRQGWLVFWSIQWLVWCRPSTRLPERAYLEGTFSLLKKKRFKKPQKKDQVFSLYKSFTFYDSDIFSCCSLRSRRLARVTFLQRSSESEGRMGREICFSDAFCKRTETTFPTIWSIDRTP